MKHRINTVLFVITIVLIYLFLHEQSFFFPLLGIVVFIYLFIVGMGVFSMKYNYFLQSTTHLTDKFCLLTFDDGPHEEYTPVILDILAKHDIKAVFFVIGEKVVLYPDIVQRIVSEGHLIGNHSYSHNNFTSLFSKTRLYEDIDKAQKIIEETVGFRPRLFRPPIGHTNPRYATVLKAQKLHCMGWTLHSYDTMYADPMKLTARMLSKLYSGNIVILHDDLQITAQMLDQFIVKAKEKGNIFVSAANIQSVLNV